MPTPSEGVKSAYRRYRHCSDVLHVLHHKTPSEGVDILPFSRLLWKEWNCRGVSTGAYRPRSDTVLHNNKKRGELDFVIELSGRILPIEVKSGKYYEVHLALSNILDCSGYSLEDAIVLNNGNLRKEGKILYAPVYMVMFLEKKNDAPSFYKVDLSGLQTTDTGHVPKK